MRKQLQSQIKEIAEQILLQKEALKTTSLKQSIQKLYEKLSVLEYLEAQIFETEQVDTEQGITTKNNLEENRVKDAKTVLQSEVKERAIEVVVEEIKNTKEQPKHDVETNQADNFASQYKQMPVFERKDTVNITEKSLESPSIIDKETLASNPQEITTQESTTINTDIGKLKSINDTVIRGFSIGLNDRLAFIKHLFDGKTEDYTRVLSQINSFSSYEEALFFIETKVKPDYNNWLDKEDVSKRFIDIVQKNFN